MKSQNSAISRRDLVKFGGVAAIGALGTQALAGCSSQETKTTPDYIPEEKAAAAAAFTPMTEDDRVVTIADPAFMGAKTNSFGQEVIVSALPRNGGMTTQVCIDKDEEFEPALYKVTDRIYCSVGSCNANSVMIIGDSGIIIVDTGENKETAQMDLDQFRTVTDKPVVAVVATHDHYFGGTTAYVGDGNPDNIPIIAHEDLVKVKYAAGSTVNTIYRVMHQFGMMLPTEGDDALVGAGMGRYMSNPKIKNPTDGFLPPNNPIPGDVEMTEMTIDGIRFQFWPMISDSSASINIWLPDEHTAISNHVWTSFYNTYTLRGASYRDPNDTIRAIDKILSWKPENHVSCHGLPLIGSEECEREILLYRDGLQFMYDQTVRFLNKAYSPDDIVRNVHMPRQIIESKCGTPTYGSIEHYVRGIYGGIVGWFGVDALELHPVNKEFESMKIVEAMGGVDSVVAEAQLALDDNQYAWAATLASHVLRTDPESAAARNVKAQAYREMGYRSDDSMGRNWYLTAALQLEGNLTVPVKTPTAPGVFKISSKNFIIKLLGVNLVPEQAEGVNMSMAFNFVDTGDVVTMSIHNCVAQAIDGSIDNPTVELKMPFELVGQCASGATNVKDCIKEGTIELVGNESDLETILGCFEMAF